MTLRLSKCALLFAVAFYYALVVFNNTTDYNSNYQFVHHVLLMDSTFPGNSGMWRALHSTVIHHAFYISIITWEALTMILSFAGAFQLARNIQAPVAAFNTAKRIGIIALTLSLLMWFVAFLSVGAEWFLMWQSREWNGQEAAGRMFTLIGILLVYLALPEHEQQA
jgi:predicted small integral membrane protein